MTQWVGTVCSSLIFKQLFMYAIVFFPFFGMLCRPYVFTCRRVLFVPVPPPPSNRSIASCIACLETLTARSARYMHYLYCTHSSRLHASMHILYSLQTTSSHVVLRMMCLPGKIGRHGGADLIDVIDVLWPRITESAAHFVFCKCPCGLVI